MGKEDSRKRSGKIRRSTMREGSKMGRSILLLHSCYFKDTIKIQGFSELLCLDQIGDIIGVYNGTRCNVDA